MPVEGVPNDESKTALCREFGVSRQAGYKWIKRFKESGYDGLEEQSRRPKTAPLSPAEDLVISVLEARDRHPTLGTTKARSDASSAVR
ncbi:helix-turn-helix domain-containing protein [Pendulispora brunnea]|uniref:helix-turn-helix domain-containing protein n=1 Tax=Pendulispora brunnea TaxID=2905690 RepID=UPI00374DFE3D